MESGPGAFSGRAVWHRLQVSRRAKLRLLHTVQLQSVGEGALGSRGGGCVGVHGGMVHWLAGLTDSPPHVQPTRVPNWLWALGPYHHGWEYKT